MDRPFDTIGTAGATPVVVSVPHAGRDYPRDLERLLAVPLIRAVALEDRCVDTLVDPAAAAGHHVVIARTPRLVIDLNRRDDDLDPAMAPPGATVSPRARGGLGVIPTRLAGVGDLWHVLPDAAEVERRLALVHRPYHAALARALAAARDRWGFVVLVDLHSMPPLTGANAAQVVIGDRHGVSTTPVVTAAARAASLRAGFRTRCNDPYAGGEIVTRHGHPSAHVHAVQIEVDRRCYLDAALLRPTPAGRRVAMMLVAAIDAMVEALASPLALAAE